MQTLKPLSENSSSVSLTWKPRSKFRLHGATLVILAVLSFAIAIATSWLLGNSHVTELFVQLHWVQENPPDWLMPPQLGNKYYLLAPSLVLFLIAQAIIKLSPQTQPWSRNIVAGILLFLVVRYFLWRFLSTLNLANPVDGIFSLLVLAMELLMMTGGTIQLLFMFRMKDRERQADKYSVAVKEQSFTPSVDILIPSYNEPDFILKRTIMGCQALDYPNKEIYLLDDTRRSEIKRLAAELGCNYIARRDNIHAKAGNLNHALVQTHGDLVVVFDADFVPTSNFLERTVGFFQNEKIGLVQTPQSFYNADPIAKNLGLEKVLTSEEEVFYRHLQPIKDAVGSVVCSGTSFVVRRKALEEVGYFTTESVSEDYFTGIQISARGYELVYLDEKLSAGLAAESITAHIDQRLRWARGTLQAFFIKSNPLTIPGLNFWQRLGHFEGLLHWFTCIPRLFFLLAPLIYIFFSIQPFTIETKEIIYVFLPYYFMLLNVFNWLNGGSRSILLSDLYSLVQAFPVARTLAEVLVRPFAKGFKVTPKGLSRERFNFNWTLACPLIILLIATSICFSLSLLHPPASSLNIGLFWNTYNLITLCAALLTLLDIPSPGFYEWFNCDLPVQLIGDNQTYQGNACKLSEEGIEILLEPTVKLSRKVNLELINQDLNLTGLVTQSSLENDVLKVRVKFNNLTLDRHRKLVQMLYCIPGQWRKKKSPGELRSIVILAKLLLRPLAMFNPKLLAKITP